MSLDGSYDMVLLPPRRDDNDGLRLARRRRALRQHPPAAEEEHSDRPRHPPRRRRRRRGNRGHARSGTLSAVAPERVDDVGTLPGDMSDIVLATETTAGVTSPRRVSPKRTDDASTLAKDLLGVTLVPEMTVCSAPDATSPPSNDQEVPSVSHPVPFWFSFDPPSDPAMVSAFVKAYPNLPGYQMWSTWDRLTAVSTFGPAVLRKRTTPTPVGISMPSMTLVPCGASCPHVTTASPIVLTMAMTLTMRVTAQVANVSTSIWEITTKATTSVCQRLTIPLGPHLALTSRGS
jgi:hypothetical protein